MKKMLFPALLSIIFALVGCSLGGGGIDVDPTLVGQWVMTDSLGGPWTDYGGVFMGYSFHSHGDIFLILSDDGGMTWDESDLDIDLTRADSGMWETDAGGFGTYTIVGDDLTWINNATAITQYLTRP